MWQSHNTDRHTDSEKRGERDSKQGLLEGGTCKGDAELTETFSMAKDKTNK